MDYKKFRDVNAWIFLAGSVISAVLSIVMMFLPEENASMSIFPWVLASVIVNLRIFGMTLRNDYNQEEYAKSISESAQNGNAKAVAAVTLVSICLTAVLMIVKLFIKIFVH